MEIRKEKEKMMYKNEKGNKMMKHEKFIERRKMTVLKKRKGGDRDIDGNREINKKEEGETDEEF